jgi:signal transduction histidine kinase
MRLRPRLILLFGLTTLLPLVLTGWVTATLGRQASISQARQLHARQSQTLALLAGTWRDDAVRTLELSLSTWDVDQLSAAELSGLQRVVYRQLDAVNVVATVDRRGALLVPATYLDQPDLGEELALHQRVEAARLQAFLERIPKPAPGELEVGEAYDPGDGRAWVLPVGLASASGASILGVELSLQELQDNFEHQAPIEGAAVLLGTGQQVLAGAGRRLLPGQATAWFSGSLSGDLEYEDSSERAILGSFQGIAGTPWSVLVAVPREQVTRPGDRIAVRLAYIYLLALALVAATAWVSAKRIAQPVLTLKGAAERIGAGRLGEQVELEGRDEIADLARSFNRMSSDLKQQAETIQEKNREIEGFNLELQQRVAERTKELQQSQARLVQSSRMAAVAQLGAGLAHELNNPIAGILGLAQVAQAQEEGREELLQAIEGEALRCRDILRALQRFSGAGSAAAMQRIDLWKLVAEVLGLLRSGMEEAQIHVDLGREVEGEVRGDAALLGQAITQLLRSLRANLAPQGRIGIQGVSRLGELGLELTLQGPARPSDDDWLASGMGFWVAQQVLHEHGGRLEEPKPGTRVWTLWLPEYPT